MPLSYTDQITQATAVVGQIAPSNHASNTDRSITGIDMSVLRRLITFLDVGTINTSGTISLWYEASANSNMVGNTNMGNSGSNTFINAVTTSNQVYSLEVRADQMPANTRYIRPVLQLGTTVANVGVIALAGVGSYEPCSQFAVTTYFPSGSALVY